MDRNEYIKGRFVHTTGFKAKLSHIKYVEIDEENHKASFVTTDNKEIPYKEAIDIFDLANWDFEFMIDAIERYKWVEYDALIYDVGDIINQ